MGSYLQTGRGLIIVIASGSEAIQLMIGILLLRIDCTSFVNSTWIASRLLAMTEFKLKKSIMKPALRNEQSVILSAINKTMFPCNAA